MTNSEAFSQGARCGHIEGKDRAGQYVIGEESWIAQEAASNQNLGSYDLAFEWAKGYRHGYKLAASGDPLEPEHHL